MNRIYLGRNAYKPSEVFRSATEPTHNSHGHLYAKVIGPFRTVRAANFMRDYGAGNPHCMTVRQAEHLAKKYAGGKGS